MQDAYSKRSNILVHGVKEDIRNDWEPPTVTVEKSEIFSKEGLKIKNPENVEIVDNHRLPQ